MWPFLTPHVQRCDAHGTHPEPDEPCWPCEHAAERATEHAMRKLLVWPPTVGQRIHRDSGHDNTSWSAEVRAIVDDDYAVIKRWRKHKGWHTYEIIDRFDVEAWNRDKIDRDLPETGFFEGPLPKRHASTGEKKP